MERFTGPVPDRRTPYCALPSPTATATESAARKRTVHFDEKRRDVMDQPGLRVASHFLRMCIASVLLILLLEENAPSAQQMPPTVANLKSRHREQASFPLPRPFSLIIQSIG